MNYVDDKGEVGKLRTACGKKASQILGPRQSAVGLGQDDIDLAMALSFGSKTWTTEYRILHLA